MIHRIQVFPRKENKRGLVALVCFVESPTQCSPCGSTSDTVPSFMALSYSQELLAQLLLKGMDYKGEIFQNVTLLNYFAL